MSASCLKPCVLSRASFQLPGWETSLTPDRSPQINHVLGGRMQSSATIALWEWQWQRMIKVGIIQHHSSRKLCQLVPYISRRGHKYLMHGSKNITHRPAGERLNRLNMARYRPRRHERELEHSSWTSQVIKYPLPWYDTDWLPQKKPARNCEKYDLDILRGTCPGVYLRLSPSVLLPGS